MRSTGTRLRNTASWLSDKLGIAKEQWCYEPNPSGVYGDGMTIKAKALALEGFRLPTEAEWEYACRAGAASSRYYGDSDELLDHYAWYLLNAKGRPSPCGKLLPNDLGLFDLLGNVHEWCQDHAAGNYRPGREGTITDKIEEPDPHNGKQRSQSRLAFMRGGSYSSRPSFGRSGFRDGSQAVERCGRRQLRLSPRQNNTLIGKPERRGRHLLNFFSMSRCP